MAIVSKTSFTFLTEQIVNLNTEVATIKSQAAATYAVANGAIEVTGEGITKTIGLVLDGTTLSQSSSGLKSTLNIKKLGTATEGFAASYELQDSAGNKIGDRIDLIKDQFLKDVELVTGDGTEHHGTTLVDGAKYIHFTFEITKGATDSDTDSHIYLNVNDLFDSYTADADSGIEVDNDTNKISLVVDDADEVVTGANTSVKILSVSEDGLKVNGIQSAIDYAVSVEEAARIAAVSAEADARSAADASLESRKVESVLTSVSGGRALIFNENDGGGTKVEHPLVAGDGNKFWTYIGLNDNNHVGVLDSDVLGQIYAVDTNTGTGLRLNIYKNRLCYFASVGSGVASNSEDYEIAIKKNVSDEATRAQGVESGLDTRITALEQGGSSRVLTTVTAAENNIVTADYKTTSVLNVSISDPAEVYNIAFSNFPAGGDMLVMVSTTSSKYTINSTDPEASLNGLVDEFVNGVFRVTCLSGNDFIVELLRFAVAEEEQAQAGE